MRLIILIILSSFISSQIYADTIYNLIKIPNLEIYDIKTPNKLRYLYAKHPFTLGIDKNINCFNSKKEEIDQKGSLKVKPVLNLLPGVPELPVEAKAAAKA